MALISPKEYEQRRAAARTHGQGSAFAKGAGEDVLQPAQRSRLAELRADLATPDGVRAAMIERAARLVLIAEWGEEWLRDKAEHDGAIAAFQAPMLARFFSAAAEARRALVEVAKMVGPGDGGPADYERILEAGQHAGSQDGNHGNDTAD